MVATPKEANDYERQPVGDGTGAVNFIIYFDLSHDFILLLRASVFRMRNFRRFNCDLTVLRGFIAIVAGKTCPKRVGPSVGMCRLM